MCINMWFHITKSIWLTDTPSNIYTFNNRHGKKTPELKIRNQSTTKDFQ